MDRDMLASPAYAALSPTGRRVLALIEREVTRNGGVAAISYSNIKRSCGVIHGTCGFALRQVRLLGFFSVELEAAPPRRVNTFTPSTRWQSIDAVEAHRLAVEARLPQSRPVRVPKPRSVKRQVPSLATLTLGDW